MNGIRSLALMVMNRTDKSQQGAALGAYTSFWDLGVAVWGPLGGVIAGALGYEAVFVAGASGYFSLPPAEKPD